MKYSIIGLACMFILQAAAYAQCPKSGLVVQSQDCVSPKALKIEDIQCTTMLVSWKGSKDQQYVVYATSKKQQDEKAVEAPVSDMKSDGRDSWQATIAVSEGATINWSVRTICHRQNAVVNSGKVAGPETYIPLCSKARPVQQSEAFSIFPNPSTGLIKIDYTGRADGIVEIRVIDAGGKVAFTKTENTRAGTANHYNIDLQPLMPGAYTVELINGDDKQRGKLILLKK